MSLSSYHTLYAQRSDEDIEKRIAVKEQELQNIFDKVQLHTTKIPKKVAILGCGDVRMIEKQKLLFEKMLKCTVEMTTFDISIDHLKDRPNVVQHDCTQPLPEQPYDITYAHVLLKFIDPKKQFDALKNSYDALRPGGIAIHILDWEEIRTDTPNLPDGYLSVPLKQHEKKLEEIGIIYKEIKIHYGVALVLLK